MGLMATAQFVGSSFAPLVGGFVAESFGFAATFLVTGVLLGIAGLVVMLFVRERFVRPAPGGRRGGRLADVKLLFGAPEIGAIVAVMLAVQMGRWASAR
jgi:MFS family permease